MPQERRKELLLSFLKDKVARVLGSSPDKVDLTKPLTEVGLDSLMAVELRNWVEGELRVSLPIAELLQGPSVDRLADLLLEQLLKADTPPAPARAELRAEPPVAAEAARSEIAHDEHSNGTGNGQPAGNGEFPAHDYERDQQIGHGDAERLLERVDALSDDEVDSLLARARARDGAWTLRSTVPGHRLVICGAGGPAIRDHQSKSNSPLEVTTRGIVARSSPTKGGAIGRPSLQRPRRRKIAPLRSQGRASGH